MEVYTDIFIIEWFMRYGKGALKYKVGLQKV
jgi:hypothetical protein